MNAPPEEPDEIRPAFTEIDRLSLLVTWGLPLLGLIHAISRAIERAEWPVLAILDALYLLVAYALAGVALGSMVQALNRAFDQWSRTPSLPREAVPEALPAGPAPAHAALDLLKQRTVAEIRLAIREGKWDEARELIDAFATDHVDDPHVGPLHHEFQTAREASRDDHLAQLDVARKVNDPDRVLELHQILVPLLDVEARSSLEAELSRWFLRLIHNRLRTGKIQTDVAHLAGRIAETFSHTVEGASLRASLPTLRRSAGLCPRCAQPYTGVADACPACLGPGQTLNLPDFGTAFLVCYEPHSINSP